MRWQGRLWSRNLEGSTHHGRDKTSVRIEDAVKVEVTEKPGRRPTQAPASWSRWVKLLSVAECSRSLLLHKLAASRPGISITPHNSIAMLLASNQAGLPIDRPPTINHVLQHHTEYSCARKPSA